MSTNIEWTNETWNPTTGCTKVSTGCRDCYAEKMSKRLAAMGKEKYQGILTESGRFNGKVRTHEDTLRIPFTWSKPRKVFVDSMSDLFHADVPFDFIDKVFAVMALTPQHTYQILTKRPDRMMSYLCNPGKGFQIKMGRIQFGGELPEYKWPLPNVWLGTSVEDQAAADGRIPHLLRCPAAVRFLSCEPLVGVAKLRGSWIFDHKSGTRRIHWVIAGGESGPNARPMHPLWVKNLDMTCFISMTSFFFKQWGEWCPPDQYGFGVGQPSIESAHRHVFDDGTEVYRVGKKAAGRTLDGRTHDEFPQSPTNS
jgi:protein gp37